MTALLLFGLLLADPPPPPPEQEDGSVVRPPVLVPEAGFSRELRESRPPDWGFTAAVGAGGIVDSPEGGIALWGGLRRWLGRNAIVGGVVSFQQFSALTNLAVVARFELAAARQEARLFPSFSAYVGAGPELFTGDRGTSAGLRLVVGTHLPTIWSGIRGPINELVGALFLLVPTAIEVQVRTGTGRVRSSTALVFALAL